MAGFVGDVGAEIPPHEAMPISIVLTIQLVLQVGGDFLDGVHLVQGVLGDQDNLGFHFRVDIFNLDDGLTFPEISHSNFNIRYSMSR